MTARFGFFVALAISVKQKDSTAVESKVYPLLRSELDQWQCSLAAKSTLVRNFEFHRVKL